MIGKNNVVSKLIFTLYLVFLVIFALTIFFGGPKIGGAIYFIVFALSVTFACLDRKYHSNYINLYRFSVYLSDLFNLVAVSAIIYYGKHLPFMIAIICLLTVAFVIDLFAKNRLEKRRIESILVSVFNCIFMVAIFLYFFVSKIPLYLAIFATIMAFSITALKLVLALVPFKGEVKQEEAKSLITAEENQNELDVG